MFKSTQIQGFGSKAALGHQLFWISMSWNEAEWILIPSDTNCQRLEKYRCFIPQEMCLKLRPHIPVWNSRTMCQPVVPFLCIVAVVCSEMTKVWDRAQPLQQSCQQCLWCAFSGVLVWIRTLSLMQISWTSLLPVFHFATGADFECRGLILLCEIKLKNVL